MQVQIQQVQRQMRSLRRERSENSKKTSHRNKLKARILVLWMDNNMLCTPTLEAPFRNPLGQLAIFSFPKFLAKEQWQNRREKQMPKGPPRSASQDCNANFRGKLPFFSIPLFAFGILHYMILWFRLVLIQIEAMLDMIEWLDVDSSSF